MNTSQEQLLRLLALAIHDGVPSGESFYSINGEELFDLALQQNVYSFLYPTINKYREDIKLEEPIMHRWKMATLYLATRQLNMVNDIRTMLGLFKSNCIPVISLKGLALKKVYPQSELRSMGDLDLLVEEINLMRSIELLSIYGYYPSSKDLNDPNYMHIEMQKPGSFSIELHRTLWHPTIMRKRDTLSWFKHVWENKRLQELEELQFTALSLEDELIHLVIHHARHLMHSDANLLQLCDIVLFIKAYWDIMDTRYIDQTLRSMDLLRFYQHVLTTCHLFLRLNLPINNSILENNKSEILLNDIFNSKIHRRTIDEGDRRFVREIKNTLHHIPLAEKFVEFLKGFNTRSRFLRSIGL